MQLDAEDEDQGYYKPPVMPLPVPSTEASGERLSGETAVETTAAVES